MQYIDAEKLKKELEMRKTVYIGHALSLKGSNLIDGFDEALSIIDSLQQEPVEKTFEDYLKATPAERRKMNMTKILGAEKLAKVKEMMEQPTNNEQEQPEKKLTFDGFVDKVGTWFANLRLNKFRKTFNGEIFPATQLVQEYDLFVRELSKTYSDKQEQPKVDLEQEVISYFQGIWPDTTTAEGCNTQMSFTPPAILRLARHIAEWQYQKDRGEFAKIKVKTWCEGFDAHKEQMLKDTVEGFIFQSEDYYPKELVAHYDGDLKSGDKVRIIIIKEDKK